MGRERSFRAAAKRWGDMGRVSEEEDILGLGCLLYAFGKVMRGGSRVVCCLLGVIKGRRKLSQACRCLE